MSYWSVGDKMDIAQRDIQIFAEGNNEFTEGQVIGIYIPPNIKFINGKDCRVCFDIKITNDTTGTNAPTKLCLDGLIGANSLFSQVRTYAGNRAKLLEETRDYSSLVSLMYSYDNTDSQQKKRALVEGCGYHSQVNRGTLGTAKSIQNNIVNSAYNECGNIGENEGNDIDTLLPFTTACVELQLHMGVFANSVRAFPSMLTQGLYVELTLAQNKDVFRQLDGATKHRKLALNPVFHSLNGNNTNWDDMTASNEFYVSPLNAQNKVAHFPFQVGEHLGFADKTSATGSFTLDGNVVITKIEEGTAKAPIKITIANARTPTALMTAEENKIAIYSKSTTTDGATPKYTLTNVRMKVREVIMADSYVNGMVSKMKSNGTIMIDLPSYSTQNYSSLKEDTQPTIPIYNNHRKSKSILVLPTDSKNYAFHENCDSTSTYLITDDEPCLAGVNAVHKKQYSDRSGISGIGDYLTSYYFVIDNKQVPNREVETDLSAGRGTGLNATHLLELEKSLKAGAIPPRSFKNFRENFAIGRALSLDDRFVYDGVGKEIRLNLKYEGLAPQKNKLYKIFIHHIKTLMIKGVEIDIVN